MRRILMVLSVASPNADRRGGTVAAEAPSRFQERRRERLQLPPCPACRSMLVTVASRTPHMLYLRCRDCHTIWSVSKPGVKQLGE